MNNMRYCPNCGAPIQDGARFCLHCMTSLEPKQKIQKQKTPLSKRRKTIIVIISVVLALAVAAGGITGVYFYQKHLPVCTYSNFTAAIVKTSDRMGADDLWSVSDFKDIMSYEDENTVRYSTNINLDDAFLSVFFYNKGERINAYICDVDESRVEDGKKLLICVAQAACNNYFSDIEEVMNDRNNYPFETLTTSPPFDKYYTDLLERTDQYNTDIKNGAKFTTQYIGISAMDKYLINYLQTERQYSDKTLYDLSITIEKA